MTLPAFAAILPNFNQNDSFTTASTSGFVHGQFAFTDAFSLTAGGRYTDEKKTYAFDHSPYLFIPGELKYGSSHFDWKVSADYRFSPAAMLYGNVSTGFRSDGAQPRPFTPGQQRVPVPAEELTSYEIGTKLDLLDRRLRINLAVFQDDYDPRIFTSNGTQCNAISNLDPGRPSTSRRAGSARPARRWAAHRAPRGSCMTARRARTGVRSSRSAPTRFRAWRSMRRCPGSTSSRAAGRSNPDGSTNFGYVDPSFDVQAKYSGSLGAQYTFQVGGGSLIPRIDFFYQGSRSNGVNYLPQLPGRDNEVPSYTMANARISWAPADNKWELAL